VWIFHDLILRTRYSTTLKERKERKTFGIMSACQSFPAISSPVAKKDTSSDGGIVGKSQCGRGGSHQGGRGAQNKILSVGRTVNQAGNDVAEGISSPACSPWEPHVDHQRRNLKTDDFTLFFPFELTNKDYLKRIFDIVARGIRDPIVLKTEQKGIPNLCVDLSYDVYYLLKHLLEHQTALLPPSMQVQNLIESAKFIFNCRKALFHFDRDSARLCNLRSSFNAARELLKISGARALSISTELDALEQQYNAHKVYKENRMRKFGWSWGSDNAVDEDDATDDRYSEQVITFAQILDSFLTASSLRK